MLQLMTLMLAAALMGADEGRLSKLDVLGPNEPRAYFFRAVESAASNPRIPYERWDANFSRLMGIEGKTLEEEIPGRSERNIDVFTRFKKDHPRQLVLLHYNGNARDPRDTSAPFFAGHWIYFNGARILGDVSAEEGETEIRVDKPDLFKTEMGRYRRDNEDIGLCELDSVGRPDWSRSEQVQLIAVDVRRGVIRVRRGCYGTAPRAFTANRSYAAAHMTEGPWGRRSHLLWHYNFSSVCPRDANGKQAADILADDVSSLFSDAGRLASFDGIQFDVLGHWKTGGRARGADVDADGVADGGVVDGVNVYGIGVVHFLKQLRAKMGEDRLILADGHSERHQRGFGILNGIESEGFPSLSDHELRDWSGGLNRHAFWAANGRAPVFNYINHKFVSHGEIPGDVRKADVPFNAHRLVFAAALYTDSAVCYSTAPEAEQDGKFGVWDELWAGKERKRGWLGRALGPAVHLAEKEEDIVEGRQEDLRQNATGTKFRLSDVPCSREDLVVAVTASAEPMEGYPDSMARLMHVSAGQGFDLSDGADVVTGMRLRGKAFTQVDTQSGARVTFGDKFTLSDVTMPGCTVHPPYRNGTGLVYWQREVDLPADPTLVFHTGMGEKAPGRSDGVVFQVQVADADDSQLRWSQVFEHQQVKSEWMRHVVSLAQFKGKRLVVRFVADAGPRDNATTDHGYWGNIRLVNGPAPATLAPAQRTMSWCNGEPFTSYFYFDDLPGGYVDLNIAIEGDAGATIHKIAAYAAAEVVYRLYEKGIVVANLGSEPASIPLADLAPGRTFRRLRGSASQDPETNNGQPVGDTVNVPARDAVFLISD